MGRSEISICILAMYASVSYSGELRTWSDNTSKYKIEAELVSADGNQVTLKKSDGSSIKVPIKRLSTADQGFIGDAISPQIPGFAAHGYFLQVPPGARAKNATPLLGIAVSLPPDHFLPSRSEFDELAKMQTGADAPIGRLSPQHMRVYDPARFTLILANGERRPASYIMQIFDKNTGQTVVSKGKFSIAAPDLMPLGEIEYVTPCWKLPRRLQSPPFLIKFDKGAPIQVPSRRVLLPKSPLEPPQEDLSQTK